MANPEIEGLWDTEKGSGVNVRHFRYADILLMNAEAAYHTGDNAKAIAQLEEIRNRASQSTFPMGYDPDFPQSYPDTTLAPLDNSIIPASGQALLDFIYLERRRELGMEHLRFWDLVRTGRFMDTMAALYGNDYKTEATKHIAPGNTVNPVPVFPIPAIEVAEWDIAQNPNYD
jgi:hypothetical protein